ncbi:MAG: hypothetical protein JNK72_24670 [Myxococcales bacterium]|nr:hypothetical protein [Myxococcales bacterium]
MKDWQWLAWFPFVDVGFLTGFVIAWWKGWLRPSAWRAVPLEDGEEGKRRSLEERYFRWFGTKPRWVKWSLLAGYSYVFFGLLGGLVTGHWTRAFAAIVVSILGTTLAMRAGQYLAEHRRPRHQAIPRKKVGWLDGKSIHLELFVSRDEDGEWLVEAGEWGVTDRKIENAFKGILLLAVLKTDETCRLNF